MSLQDELRKAVAAKDTYKVQDLLDQIARRYIETSMRHVRAVR